MSRSALIAELASLRSEIVKYQLIAATRLDVIRLLGFMMNRDPAPDPMTVTPQSPEVRRLIASELKNLAVHLRLQADSFEQTAAKLA